MDELIKWIELQMQHAESSQRVSLQHAKEDGREPDIKYLHGMWMGFKLCAERVKEISRDSATYRK